MALQVGKRVVAESESTSRRPRAGVVEEVLGGDPSPRYRIRWDDGHDSIYIPASGALRAEPRPKRQRQPTPHKRSAEPGAIRRARDVPQLAIGAICASA